MTGLLLSAALALAVGAILLSLSGCDPESCQKVQSDYEQAVSRESGFVDLEEEGAPHLAMAMRLDLVNDLAGGLIDVAVNNALDIRGTLDLGGGQSANYSFSPTEADLQLQASDACNACLRVFGDIEGDIDVTLPVVGRQSSPLSGSMDWTVPLDVARDDDEIAIFLDTAEAVRMGAPEIDARLTQLSDNWSGPVTSALVRRLSEAVANEVDPVRLVGYETPELGVDGLEIAPSLFSLHQESNALILGIRTNLDVHAERRPDSEFVEALSLADGQNTALAIQPRLVVESARLALRQNKVARRYSLTGNADRNGPAYAVVDDFELGAVRGENAVATGLDFRIFNFRSTLGCFGMNGMARSKLAVENNQLAFDVENIEFSGPGGIAEAANWASAEFVKHAEGVVRHSLDDDVVLSPGVGLRLAADRVGTGAGMLVVGGSGEAN